MPPLSDETPEGRSIVILAKKQFGLRSEDIDMTRLKFIPFSAHTRMSGVDFLETRRCRQVRKGASDAVIKHIEALGGNMPPSTCIGG